MSDHIYSQLFSESTSSLRICQYVHCGAALTKPDQKKFCNLTCCNSQNALRQKQEAEKRRADKQAAYEVNPKKCLECDQAIPYSVTLNGHAKFCTQSCAAKFTNRTRPSESRKAQGQRLSAKIQSGIIGKRSPLKIKYCKVNWKICEITGKPYHTRMPGKGRRQKSPYAKDYFDMYYQLAKFKFNVYHMPDLFDLDLVARLGWYSCPGQKKPHHTRNTNGVSRDHLYSISKGMQFRIHPLILAHPVNCRLIQHKQNKAKQTLCDITLEELVEGIKQFDNTNNKFKHHDLILKLIENEEIHVLDWELLRKLI